MFDAPDRQDLRGHFPANRTKMAIRGSSFFKAGASYAPDANLPQKLTRRERAVLAESPQTPISDRPDCRCISNHHRVIDLVTHESAYICCNLGGQIIARIEHGENNAMNDQNLIQGFFDLLHG